MKIHLIHGIHTSRGSRRLAAMKPILWRETQQPVEYYEYGDIKAIQTRVWNPWIAKRFAKTIAPGDVIVAHSNGNAIAIRAMRDFGAKPAGLVMLNAALEPDVEIPACLKWAHCYFNEHDGAVAYADFLFGWPFDPLWGEMGLRGYKGTDTRVTNYDEWNQYELPPIADHSGIIGPENILTWGAAIGQRIKAALGG